MSFFHKDQPSAAHVGRCQENRNSDQRIGPRNTRKGTKKEFEVWSQRTLSRKEGTEFLMKKLFSAFLTFHHHEHLCAPSVNSGELQPLGLGF